MVTTNVIIIKRDQVDTMSNSGEMRTRPLSTDSETKNTKIVRLKRKRKFLSRIFRLITRDRRDIVMTEIQSSSSSFLVPTVPWTISKGGRRSYPESYYKEPAHSCVCPSIDQKPFEEKNSSSYSSLFSAGIVATRDST